MHRAEVFINLDGWTELELDKIIREASSIADSGLRISFLSDMFLGLPYRGSTLRGSNNSKEVLTVDLSGVDCFTFIDYVEAMRCSVSFDSFLRNLRRVRYRDESVAYEMRKHFFTDWAGPAYIDDVTGDIGGGNTKSIVKVLNLSDNGSPVLHGLKPEKRILHYLPTDAIDSSVLTRIKNGDYAGIYSPMQGLDVSHVGIIKKETGRILFRHASSDTNYRKVLDQDLRDYISGKPGLIVLRARDCRT